MLKVAVIIERAEIGLGGAERSVSELTNELRRQGVDATILAAKGDSAENTIILCEDYPGKRVPLKIFETVLRDHLLNTAYDIVHSTLPLTIADVYQPRGGSYREAMLQNIASYSSSCRRFVKRWTHRLNFKRTQYLNAEQRLCEQSNVIITALSQYVKEHFQKHYQVPDSRIAVIPNGINDTYIQPDNSASMRLKESILKSVRIPANKQPVLFLFAATNPRLKGIGPLVAVMALMGWNTPENVHPVLVAAGSETFKSRMDNIVSLGKVDNLRDTLSICDIAVLPTWYDPCSRFILEALAMGKPVITTRFNGAAERFEHQKHGIILDRPDDIAAMTAAMETFCDRNKIELAHRAILDDNLRQDVSITKHVEKLIELYEKVLAQKEK